MKHFRKIVFPTEIFSNPKLKRKIYLILSIAFVLRIGLFLYTLSVSEANFLLPDSIGYLQLSENISAGNGYSLSPEEPFYPDFFRTPLYPGILLMVLNSGAGITGVILLQIFAGLITLYLTMLTAFYVSGSGKAFFLAGVLFVLDIPSLVMGNFIMTENIFTLLFISGVFSFVIWLRSEKNTALLLSSISFGLAALTRPLLIFFPIFICVFFIIYYRKSFRVLIKKTILFLIPFLILTGSWMARNYIHHNHFFFSHIGTFNLLYFQAADIYSKANNVHINEARTVLYEETAAEISGSPYENPLEFYRRMRSKAVRVVFSEPGILAKNMLLAEFNLFFRPMQANLERSLGAASLYGYDKEYLVNEARNSDQQSMFILSKATVIFQIVFNIFLFSAMLFGFYLLYKKQKQFFFFFLTVIAYFLLVCSGPEVEARFRVPLIPVMVILAANGVVNLRKKPKSI